MQCPKCETNNADDRVACWKCLADLGGIKDNKPRESTKKAARNQPVSPEQTETPVLSDASQFTEEVQAEISQQAAEIKREKRTGGKKFPVLVLVPIIAALAAAWWFLLANPSPVPVAKEYITANGARLGINTQISKVGDPIVTGNTADVTVYIKPTISGAPQGFSLPEISVRIILMKEGSFLRPHWSVDEFATRKLLEEAAKRPKSLPKSGPGPVSMPGMPPMPGR